MGRHHDKNTDWIGQPAGKPGEKSPDAVYTGRHRADPGPTAAEKALLADIAREARRDL